MSHRDSCQFKALERILFALAASTRLRRLSFRLAQHRSCKSQPGSRQRADGKAAGSGANAARRLRSNGSNLSQHQLASLIQQMISSVLLIDEHARAAQ